MKEKILKNWPFMLLSFVLAFTIWFVVVQITDPQTTKTIKVPIEFINESVITERGMVVEVTGSTTVSVKVTKARSIVSALTEDDFSAVADYSQMYRDTQVPITITSRNTDIKATDFEQDAASVEVELEGLKEVTRVIEYELIGTPSTGYVVNSVTLDPESITITCPESQVPYMRTAKVYLDVTDLKESKEMTAQLKLLDGNQDEIDYDSNEHITLDTNGVIECYVDIHQIQNTPVTANIIGTAQVAEGYRYTGYYLSADSIKLYGARESVTALTEIKLPIISLSGLSESFSREIDIQSLLPSDVSVYKDSTTVTIYVTIEKLETKVIKLSTSDIEITGLSDDLTAEPVDVSYTVTIEGLASDLTNVTAKDITGSITLTDAQPGELSAEPDIIFTKKDCSVVAVDTVELTVSEVIPEEPTETEEATTEEESTTEAEE